MKLVKVVKGKHCGQVGFVKDVKFGVATIIPLVDEYKPRLFKVSLNQISLFGRL